MFSQSVLKWIDTTTGVWIAWCLWVSCNLMDKFRNFFILCKQKEVGGRGRNLNREVTQKISQAASDHTSSKRSSVPKPVNTSLVPCAWQDDTLTHNYWAKLKKIQSRKKAREIERDGGVGKRRVSESIFPIKFRTNWYPDIIFTGFCRISFSKLPWTHPGDAGMNFLPPGKPVISSIL